MSNMGCLISADIKDSEAVIRPSITNQEFPKLCVDKIKFWGNKRKSFDIDTDSDSEFPPNFMRNRHRDLLNTKTL